MRTIALLPLLIVYLLVGNACKPIKSDKSGIQTVYKEDYRPQVHFSPPNGWMNDPNGMVYYEVENGGQNEGQLVTWDAKGTKGTVIAALGGTIDWYDGDPITCGDRNHKTLTKNSLNYLVDLALAKKQINNLESSNRWYFSFI